ncbi:4-hydroxybenzoyl-CoA thioesterase [Rhodopseudomonas palustris BisB5]|uniref:4-hydroxybenzoyl-CoA thioesterase n=1 Tax=Rhodopseudomonas palustris (strain BisB5) TaxID=316057 RepID=Q137X4_RHOPS|nr:4-hydroxybenzoyl-CoA thioesterase [Rhodopseudomonas palustris BisB5]
MNASWPGRKTPRFRMFEGAHGIDLPKRRALAIAEPSHAQLDGEICDGIHRMLVRVYYEDTDFSGIVYHANYLRFLERGRSNYLRLLGADQRALFADGSGAPGYAFVVRAMQLEFLKSARMDDVLEVVTTPLEVKGASITMGQQILRGGIVLCDAKLKIAFVTGGRVRPIPRNIRAAMATGRVVPSSPFSIAIVPTSDSDGKPSC